MFIRSYWIYRLCLIHILIFILLNFLFYSKSFKEKSIKKSLYEYRSNKRLFYLNQRFSHINITKLLLIQSTSAKTLTYFCSKFCGGWGDRLRGITSTYILAILLERRFQIDMQYPLNITNFLQPNFINWIPNTFLNQEKNFLKLDPMHKNYGNEFYLNVSSRNLTKIWLNYDNIYLTTNDDYISIALKNPFFNLIKSKINIKINESTQQELFSFIYEFLFKPTSIIINNLNQLLLKNSLYKNQSIICLHIRLGQNPTMPNDKKLVFRKSIVYDMIDFINIHFNNSKSSIFLTTDSYQIQEYFSKRYNNNRLLSIEGPIIHIDRYNSKITSKEIVYQGFLKVISEFYFLGECDVLIKARSGFSDWANHRRLNKYSNLYLYCRGIHQVTGPKWRRPYDIC